MTSQELAREMERLAREDGKRPAEVQLRDLIDAGVIDEKGRVLIGGEFNINRKRNHSANLSHSRKAGHNGKPAGSKTPNTRAVEKRRKKR